MQTKKNKICFTLLEVMVAIVLLAIASGFIGLKMFGAIQKKRFESELERLKARLQVCHRIAMASQADWRGVLKQNGKEWTFLAYCDENPTRRFSSLTLHSQISFNGERVQDISFDFFSSGHVSPEGTLVFLQKDQKEIWKLEDLFLLEEGSKLGPLHPSKSK